MSGLLEEINKIAPEIDVKTNGWKLKRKYIAWAKKNGEIISFSGYSIWLLSEIYTRES